MNLPTCLNKSFLCLHFKLPTQHSKIFYKFRLKVNFPPLLCSNSTDACNWKQHARNYDKLLCRIFTTEKYVWITQSEQQGNMKIEIGIVYDSFISRYVSAGWYRQYTLKKWSDNYLRQQLQSAIRDFSSHFGSKK